jgi:rubrerythrin
LVTAERVARRQYDELLMFPDLSKFVPDILYIRNDEHEHEEILLCMIKKLGSPAAAQPIMQPTSQQSVTLTPKALGEFYETILDRFGDEEEKSVNSYQELLVKVQSSTTALINARMQKNMSMESYQEAIVPLNELERKINKHLNEERVHLDVIDAMQEMFSNMKLGKVY